MIAALDWLSLGVCLLALLYGSRAAYPLAVSLGFCTIATLVEAQFEAPVWASLDIAVACAIVLLRPRLSDWLALLLFIPSWALYAADEWTRYYGVTAIVILQFLVTLPWQRIGSRLIRTMPHLPAIDDLFKLKRSAWAKML